VKGSATYSDGRQTDGSQLQWPTPTVGVGRKQAIDRVVWNERWMTWQTYLKWAAAITGTETAIIG